MMTYKRLLYSAIKELEYELERARELEKELEDVEEIEDEEEKERREKEIIEKIENFLR